MNEELENALIDVRKSYRLLFDFQSRILDLMSFISGKFGYRYSGGYPKFSDNGPREGKGSLDLWAWDWLNFYFHEFHFGYQERDNDNIYFSIFLVTDSGFFESKSLNNKITKLDVQQFKSPEKSQSKLIFVVGKNFWQGWGHDWDEEKFLLRDEGIKLEADNAFMIFKSFNLAQFSIEQVRELLYRE